MQGDFSRLPSGSARRFSRVLMQQGRIQLDADWNEQAEINARRLESYAADVVGMVGAPLHDGGFEILPHYALRFAAVGDHAETAPQHDFAFAGSGAFTIEAWVNPAGAGGPIWCASDEHGNVSYALVRDAQGTLVFEREEVNGKRESLRAENPLPSKSYTCVAVVHHGHAVTIYFDGIACGHKEGFGRAAERRCHFIVGAASHGAPAHSFAGEIGPVLVWGGALRESDLAEHCRGPLLNHSGLLAGWLFDGPSGKTIPDISGHRHDLHLKPGSTGQEPVRSLNLRVGGGRYYVGGRRCENPRWRFFADQPWYPGACLPETRGLYLVYLETWERFVSSIEDPGIREIALGGADTTARLENVWQVKLLSTSSHDYPEWAELERRLTHEGHMTARRARSGSPLDNQLYRVEIHQAGRAPSANTAGLEAAVNLPGGLVARDTLPDEWRQGMALAVWREKAHSHKPDLVVVSSIDRDASLIGIDMPPAAWSQGEMVRIHAAPTCKWSRENASVAFAVAAMDGAGNKLVVDSALTGPRALLRGQWIELGDDDSTLLSRHFGLRRIENIDPGTGEVFVDSIPEGFTAERGKHPFLRRWDQGPASSPLPNGEIAIVSGEWVHLEFGIEVKFEDDWYRAGDYWTIPARSLQDTIEWPQDSKGPIAKAPEGIHRLTAPLALIQISERGVDVLRSLRRTFRPLTDIAVDETGFILKAGDTMTGPLSIADTLSVDKSVTVKESLNVMGEVRAGLFAGSLDAGMVGTDQIRDHAVTREKLSFALDPAPPGSVVVEPVPHPPPGYRYTGAHIETLYPDPSWRRSNQPAPGEGPLAAVAHRNHIYVLMAAAGFWRFNIETGAWEQLPNPHSRRSSFAMAYAHGKIYVFGGIEDGRLTPNTLSYDAGNGEWREHQAMGHARAGMAITELGGRIHLIGGEERSIWGRRPSRIHEAYDVNTGEWRVLAPLPKPRAHASAVVIGDCVHVIGGERARLLRLLGRTALSSHEQYLPGADEWRHREPLRVPAVRFGCGVLGGRIHVFGGEQPLLWARTILSTHQEYDPSLNWWVEKPPLPLASSRFAVVETENTLNAIGGFTPRRPGLPMIRPLASVFYLHRKV